MSDQPIVVCDGNNDTLAALNHRSAKLLGQPRLHINSAKTDEERLQIAQKFTS